MYGLWLEGSGWKLRGLGLEPKGSKFPDNRVIGTTLENNSEYNIWGPKPPDLGTWTPWGRFAWGVECELTVEGLGV